MPLTRSVTFDGAADDALALHEATLKAFELVDTARYGRDEGALEDQFGVT